MKTYSRLLALLLVFSILETGCARFIVRPKDGPVTAAAKVLTRTVFGVGTLGGTEVHVYAAKKNEQIEQLSGYPTEVEKLTAERNRVVNFYWGAVAVVVIIAVAAILVVSAACDNGSSQGTTIHTKQGTCSYHGGVGRCVNGVAVCLDGQVSPGRQSCYVD